jgi:hypothetical protein
MTCRWSVAMGKIINLLDERIRRENKDWNEHVVRVMPETGRLKGFCYIGLMDDGSQAIGYSQGDCSVDELLDACTTLQDQIEQIPRSR